MRKHLLLTPVFIALLSACGQPDMPERPKRSAEAGAQDQIADQPVGETLPPNGETPSTNEEPVTPPAKPVADKPQSGEVFGPPKPPAKPAESLPAVLPASGPVGLAMNAALKGPELKKHKLYGFTWNIEPASWSSAGKSVRIEGSFKHVVSWDFDDTIYYELIFEDGKLIKSDYFVSSRGTWLSLAAPVVSGVGLAYGIPIPLDAMVTVADKIEKLLDGNWEQAAQKLVLRIGAEAYYRGLRRNIVGP